MWAEAGKGSGKDLARIWQAFVKLLHNDIADIWQVSGKDLEAYNQKRTPIRWKGFGEGVPDIWEGHPKYLVEV